MTDTANGTRSGQLFNLKLWHLVLFLIIQVIGYAAGWGSMTQKVDDLRERQTRTENNSVITRSEFDAFRTDVLQRMDRIEQEILEEDRLDRTPAR